MGKSKAGFLWRLFRCGKSEEGQETSSARERGHGFDRDGHAGGGGRSFMKEEPRGLMHHIDNSRIKTVPYKNLSRYRSILFIPYLLVTFWD